MTYNHPSNIIVTIGSTDRYQKEFYSVANQVYPYDEAFQHGYNYNIGMAKDISYLFKFLIMTMSFVCSYNRDDGRSLLY